MNVQEAYNSWAVQYDTNENKTRDLEAAALKQMLQGKTFDRVLEIGCGTGKNTAWLQTIAKEIVAVDFSEEMLARAKQKIQDPAVYFQQADITKEWDFAGRGFDLVTFSLVLEHIEDLNPIFAKTAGALNTNGLVYIGELHPFKQYQGSKARFETTGGTQVVTCFNHHVSDFLQPALAHSLALGALQEHFDDGDKATVPRILSLLLRKK